LIQIKTLNEGGDLTDDLQAKMDKYAKLYAGAKKKYAELAKKYNAQGKELTKKLKAAYSKQFTEKYTKQITTLQTTISTLRTQVQKCKTTTTTRVVVKPKPAES